MRAWKDNNYMILTEELNDNKGWDNYLNKRESTTYKCLELNDRSGKYGNRLIFNITSTLIKKTNKNFKLNKIKKEGRISCSIDKIDSKRLYNNHLDIVYPDGIAHYSNLDDFKIKEINFNFKEEIIPLIEKIINNDVKTFCKNHQNLTNGEDELIWENFVKDFKSRKASLNINDFDF